MLDGEAVHIHRADGFTLLELLVTLAVAAILLGVAIPSYRGLVQRNTVTVQVNDLVGDLNYARSQAVTRGTPVTLCTSANLSSCVTSGSWTQGWIVYATDPSSSASKPNASNILRVHSALSSQITIVGNQNIGNTATFDSNGFAMSSIGTFTASGTSVPSATCVVIAGTGRIRTDTSSTCTN